MPGFIIHLAEARRIVDVMKTEYGEDGLYELYERFALGCILPDITDDKEKTHFRPEWQKNLITKYPDIDLVLKAYEGKQLTPEDMGDNHPPPDGSALCGAAVAGIFHIQGHEWT